MVMLRILGCKRDLQEKPLASNSVGGGTTVISRTTHLNKGIKRLPTRSIEILLGLKHDLISPSWKRQMGRDEVRTPPVLVRDGRSDYNPHPCVSWGQLVGLLDAWCEELDFDVLSWFADG